MPGWMLLSLIYLPGTPELFMMTKWGLYKRRKEKGEGGRGEGIM
jgi:hypothetical protein